MATYTTNFNPRSPHRERHRKFFEMELTRGFQSTLPSQGATMEVAKMATYTTNFNPRSPHRERHFLPLYLPSTTLFQSTLPSQGATYISDDKDKKTGISIHAPLTGSDGYYKSVQLIQRDFNPRSPHRERLLTL